MKPMLLDLRRHAHLFELEGGELGIEEGNFRVDEGMFEFSVFGAFAR